MQDLTRCATRRLYEVSRDLYAPVLAAFAADWLDELARRPAGIALCLGRDGLTPFLTARTLLRLSPQRFHGLRPRSVQLAYVSRPLAQGAVVDPRQAALLDRYLRGRGAGGGTPLTLVDVGIHGSIQDCLQRIYPERPVHGRYLVLRRRDGDPHGARKRGFLAELDVAPRVRLSIDPSWPPPPGWEAGGTLRGGDSLFLRPGSVHVLEDLWNGVGEAVDGLRETACGGRVVAVRQRIDRVLTLPPEPALTPVQRIALKRAALRGVVDGVAQIASGDGLYEASTDAVRNLGHWLHGLEDPDPLDRYILTALVRGVQRRMGHADESGEG